MSGFDDLESNLMAAVRERQTSAVAVAPQGAPRRRARSSGTRTIWLAGIALFGTSGVAFASHGLWMPVLGSSSDQVQEAVKGAPAQEALGALAILRRPQTDADRGSAAQYAVRFPNNQRYVRTNFVRALGVSVRGNPVVLIPTGASEAAGPADEFCLWVAGVRGGGSGTCASIAAVKEGKLTIAVGAAPDTEREAQRARDRKKTLEDMAAAGAESAMGSGETFSDEETMLTVVGLVPDGIESVELPGEGSAKVAANAWKASISEGEFTGETRLRK